MLGTSDILRFLWSGIAEAKDTITVTENAKLQGTVFRVKGIPLETSVDELNTALSSEFTSEAKGAIIDGSQTTICPSCDSRDTLTALIQFARHPPPELDNLQPGHSHQFKLGDSDLDIDKDFYGLTQLYPVRGEIKVDVVAVCGLDGHAYGSWTAPVDKENRRKMWLRNFLSVDLPQSRTMIFGYNSKLQSKALHTILDYTELFLEELKKARESHEEKDRPIIFIGHSFGGIIVAQSIVRAKDSDKKHGALFSRTRATVFFGTPHRGLVVNDILAMVQEGSARENLVKSIESGSSGLETELKRFINYAANADIKIVSFKEIEPTRKLVKGSNGGWSRSGDYFEAVESKSSILDLPETIEETLSVDGDHSTMVKFRSQNQSYRSVARHLKTFTLDAEIDKRYPTAYQAVKEQNANALDRMVQKTPSLLNQRRNATLLHTAIDNKDKGTVKVLLEHRVDLNARDQQGNTALHIAALNGLEWAVEGLLKRDVQLDATCGKGMTALHMAAKGGHVEVLRLLLSKGADITTTVGDKKGFTALHLAARDGHVKSVLVLLEKGVDIEAKSRDKETALHRAAWGGKEGTAEALLNSGANIQAINKDRSSALHVAASLGHRKVVQLLLDKRADITAKNASGQTVLHLAARFGYEEVVKLLLSRGANIAVKTGGSKRTALHYAAEGGHEKVVKVLLDNKADTEVVSNDGYTPLQLAEERGHCDIEILLNNNITNSTGAD